MVCLRVERTHLQCTDKSYFWIQDFRIDSMRIIHIDQEIARSEIVGRKNLPCICLDWNVQENYNRGSTSSVDRKSLPWLSRTLLAAACTRECSTVHLHGWITSLRTLFPARKSNCLVVLHLYTLSESREWKELGYQHISREMTWLPSICRGIKSEN